MPDAVIHYVKFIRGTTAAWEQLKLTPERINDDTLYFIYDSAATSTDGKLYLGQKLISGSQGAAAGVDIADLADIEIDDSSLENAQLLAYNETTQKWENVDIEDLLEADIAENNSVLVKTENGLEWVPRSDDGIKREITTLEDLQTAIEEETADPNTIYMISNGESAGSDRYDEYMVINGSLERLGTFGEVDLTDYVQTTVYQAKVGDLEDRLDALEDTVITQAEVGDLSQLIHTGNNTTLVEEVNSLNERLTWQELLSE